MIALDHFLTRIALGGPVILHLAQGLIHGDPDQQFAQVVLFFDAEFPGLDPAKERTEHRLDDVFRIHLMPQSGADVPVGQGDELMGEAGEEFLSRGVVLAVHSDQEFSEGIRHGSRPTVS